MEKKRILIVDDDEHICRLVKIFLEKENYSVSSANNGEEMWALLARVEERPNLILLDLMLPGEDGLSLARQLNKQFDIPIIIVSAKDNPIEKVAGLEVGADDYISKPFHERELLARIRSVLRRFQGGANFDPVQDTDRDSESTLAFNGWHLNLSRNTLFDTSGKEVRLTSHEFGLLEAFATRPNCVLSRDTLLTLLSGRGHYPFDRSIDVLIGKLRKKIEEDSKQPKLIKTVRSRGYIFTASVSRVNGPSPTKEKL